MEAYTLVRQHAEAETPPPLRMIVSGTAGTGKSYLIHCLRLILNNRLRLAAPTGVAAFNIEGYTLHSLLSLPVKGDYKDLEGERLHRMQQTWSTSSLMRCLWWEGRCSVKWTSVFARFFPIMLTQCLEVARAYCLETLVNCPQ